MFKLKPLHARLYLSNFAFTAATFQCELSSMVSQIERLPIHANMNGKMKTHRNHVQTHRCRLK